MNGSATSRRPDVIVVGGGLAGIAAAVRLSEAGLRVRLLETRKKLGGRATSFVDVRSGRTLDNCQHVVLGCCTNYRDLLARIGAADKIRWTNQQHWVEEGGRISTLRPGLLPAPAHFTGSMLGAAFLSTVEKAAIARACLRLLREPRDAWRGRTFAEFLKGCAQTDRVVRRFWAPVVVSACNLDVGRVSASVAMHVFQEGFLASADAADIGVPAVPLVDLYAGVERMITDAGGSIELGCSVSRLDARSVTTSDGERLETAHVVCAVPVERVNRLVDPALRAGDPRLARLDSFTHSPILGVHLTFDRPVMGDLPHVVLVDRPTQWLFRKDSVQAGDPASGPAGREHVHAVISAADDWVALPEDEIGRRILADIHACFPASRSASLIEVRAVKEKLATWAPVPGIDTLRPAAVGPDGSAGLILAGDYTATGWPATMEGAVRSGYAAAAAILGRAATDLVIPPLKIAPVAAALGLRLA